MSEKKIFDLVAATKDEGIDIALSDVLPELVKHYGDVIVPEAIAGIAGEVVGAIFPRFNNIRLSYKQNRLERNISIALDGLIEQQDRLSQRLSVLEKSENGRHLISNSRELLLDNIVHEFQPEKVKYSVNGFLNLINTEDANMDMAVMFFKTIAELNDLDIRVLQNYDYRRTMERQTITPFNSEYDLEQLRFIKQKLMRLGLLRSKNDEVANRNLIEIIEYLKKVNKDANSRKPKGVKIPNFKKTTRSDSYRITALGMSLLNLISDECDLHGIKIPDEDEIIE